MNQRTAMYTSRESAAATGRCPLAAFAAEVGCECVRRGLAGVAGGGVCSPCRAGDDSEELAGRGGKPGPAVKSRPTEGGDTSPDNRNRVSDRASRPDGSRREELRDRTGADDGCNGDVLDSTTSFGDRSQPGVERWSFGASSCSDGLPYLCDHTVFALTRTFPTSAAGDGNGWNEPNSEMVK